MSDDRDDEHRRATERKVDADDRERDADQPEREAHEHARMRRDEAEELEQLRRELEHDTRREAEELEREARQLERDAKQLERMTEKVEREREREARRREHERARDDKRREHERARDEKRREHERAHDDKDRERARARDENDRERAGLRADEIGHDDDLAGPDREHRWEREWAHVERAWRHHVEQRRRWEARRAEHRARLRHGRRRWKQLHEERAMWMKIRTDKRGWGPWWLQARMRRRIFSWLAIAFLSGAITMSYWDASHWWHAVVALIGLSVMSGMIAFRLTHPLLMVIRVAQDIGDGKLETRLDVDSHRGETRLLAMAINEMAERIEQQLKDQRQLLAAVSHELRTPLGHMRVLIDTARDTADRRALAELEREVLVLDDLVGRLLASSRLEFGNLDCRPLDLGALVSDVATAAGVPPEAIEAIGDVRASVDPTLVRRAVANLLDNARVHGGGAVAVRIERRARQVAIEVDDAGPGVPADRRGDAFRAFVPSRAGGLGLGLALVSRIAVAHNGGAWITDRPGGGARVGFTVEVVPPARG